MLYSIIKMYMLNVCRSSAESGSVFMADQEYL